ncbi:MAG: hypothetical protein ACJ798_15840 [Phenylobacterium sp.]
MWRDVLAPVEAGFVRGRYRIEGEQLVLEWRGGRTAERCGLLKPEFVATARLRQLVSESQRTAA